MMQLSLCPIGVMLLMRIFIHALAARHLDGDAATGTWNETCSGRLSDMLQLTVKRKARYDDDMIPKKAPRIDATPYATQPMRLRAQVSWVHLTSPCANAG